MRLIPGDIYSACPDIVQALKVKNMVYREQIDTFIELVSLDAEFCSV